MLIESDEPFSDFDLWYVQVPSRSGKGWPDSREETVWPLEPLTPTQQEGTEQ